MKTQLTLRLDAKLLAAAERLARQRGTTVGELVEDHLVGLNRGASEEVLDLPPITRSLYGILQGYEVDAKESRRYLERKHL